jgi:hypothetical protein
MGLFFELSTPTQVAVAILGVVAITWIVSMVLALASRRPRTAGVRRFEIVVAITSVLFAIALTYLGSVIEARPKPEAKVETAPASTATGTCASIRQGMRSDQVTTLLGKPNVDKSAEDTRGPGARVMVFNETRCVVHLLDGKVEKIE